jgi:uncharacterized protein (UPF0303 family)
MDGTIDCSIVQSKRSKFVLDAWGYGHFMSAAIKNTKNMDIEIYSLISIRRIFGLAMRPTWAMRNQWVQGKKKQAKKSQISYLSRIVRLISRLR